MLLQYTCSSKGIGMARYKRVDTSRPSTRGIATMPTAHRRAPELQRHRSGQGQWKLFALVHTIKKLA
jgi:hypothetical protein